VIKRDQILVPALFVQRFNAVRLHDNGNRTVPV